MADKKDLFNKYQTIDEDSIKPVEEESKKKFGLNLFEEEEEVTESLDKPAEKKKQKAPKEKKVKEKKPKEPKPVKEKKVKEKKIKEPEAVKEETEGAKPVKEKKVKEKKSKEPKPVKEKKVKKEKTKEPKPVKEKKSKEKKSKEPKVKNKDAAFEEQLTKKDHITFVLILITLVIAVAFVCVKFVPMLNEEQEPTEPVTEMKNLSELRVDREDVSAKYMQSDIKSIFYSWLPENVVQYYQYDDKKIKVSQPTGNVSATMKMGEDEINVTVDYVQNEDGIFGMGFYSNEQNISYKKVVFKLTNLPKGYEQEGKALLLATTDTNVLSEGNSRWADSFVVELETGKTTRFLSNTETDLEKAAGFSVLTDEAYMTSDGKIPFFTTRKYEAISGKKDIFVKEGTKEYSFAEDVYGSYVVVDGTAIVYMRATETGFNVVRKDGEEETVVFTFEGDFNMNYLCCNEYILEKNSGRLYNVKSGSETKLAEFKMIEPEFITVSADGKNLIVLGTVKNVVDYQLYIYNLESGSCTKYEDTNFSKHTNITFINDTMVVCSAVSPEKGYENTIIDISKINKK